MKIQCLHLVLLISVFAVATSFVLKSSEKPLKEEGRNLARVDATLKSYLGNPLTGLVYAASLCLGAISLLAMYESPLSPLPVPSLPRPPVGRFPPENPIWPPINIKNPMKMKEVGPTYSASAMNPIFSMAPQYQVQQQGQLKPNLGQGYGIESSPEFYNQPIQYQSQPQLTQQQPIQYQSNQNQYPGASYGSNQLGPQQRRQDIGQNAHLQPYINHMSQLPVIRKVASQDMNLSGSSPNVAVATGSISEAGDLKVSNTNVAPNGGEQAMSMPSSQESSSINN